MLHGNAHTLSCLHIFIFVLYYIRILYLCKQFTYLRFASNVAIFWMFPKKLILLVNDFLMMLCLLFCFLNVLRHSNSTYKKCEFIFLARHSIPFIEKRACCVIYLKNEENKLLASFSVFHTISHLLLI